MDGRTSAAASAWRSATVGAALPGLLLAAGLLLPFLGKAHTIDDVTFLLEARHVLTDPLHPTAFEMVADGERIRLSSQLVSGPVMAWLLAPAAALGGAEWAAHLVQLVLVLVAVLATVSLALRLGFGRSEARLAGVLLATTPVVTVLATTSMSDVPAMAFGVIGVERLWTWRTEGRLHQAVAATLGLALAPLARSHLLLLLPIGALAGWVAGANPRAAPARRVAWLPVALAALVFLAVDRITADPAVQRGDLLGALSARFEGGREWGNLIALAAHWVLVMPLALPWVVGRGSKMARSPALWALALGLAALLVAFGHAARPPLPRRLVPVVLLGFVVMADVLLDAVRRRDSTQLMLGCWLLIALPTTAYVHTPAKYLVPSAPAAALLVARLARRGEGVWGGTPAWASAIAGAALGLAVTIADAEFADIGRRATRELITPRVAAGERVWFAGGWGAQWYAMQAGATPFAQQPPFPLAGEILVVSEATSPTLHAPGLDSLARRTFVSRHGRIMAAEAGAGFYSNGWGVLPWTWTNGTIDRWTVWRVR